VGCVGPELSFGGEPSGEPVGAAGELGRDEVDLLDTGRLDLGAEPSCSADAAR
jgi:hypothetical protein